MSVLLSFIRHPGPLAVGSDAPPLSLTADDGAWVRSDDYPTQTLVIVFLSALTDGALLRELEGLRAGIEAADGRLFAVNHARPDLLREARAAHDLGFKLLYDLGAWSSRAWHQAGRRPYVRDGVAVVRGGKVVHHTIGPVETRSLAAVLGAGRTDEVVEAGSEIDWTNAESRLAEGFVLVDVRTPDEFGAIHHPAAKNIPLDELPARIGELGGAKRVIAVCQTGGRSQNAVGFLRSSGVTDASSIHGGMNAWAGRV